VGACSPRESCHSAAWSGGRDAQPSRPNPWSAIGPRVDGDAVGFSKATTGSTVSALAVRRGFLKTALTLLTGALPRGWAVQPNVMGTAHVDVTPNHVQELLVRLSEIDGLHLRRIPEEDLPPTGGLALGLYRYEGPQGLSRTVDRLVLPWMDVRAGLYLRSAVPYRTRILLDPADGSVTTRILFGRRTSVHVYRETPRWVDGPPWQVIVVGGAPRGGVSA
jgi:hypothetical protein